MIKPILYHDIQEKNKIEAVLMLEISQEERLVMSNAIMDLFANTTSISSEEDFNLSTQQKQVWQIEIASSDIKNQ